MGANSTTIVVVKYVDNSSTTNREANLQNLF